MIQHRSLIAAVIAMSTVALAVAQGPGPDGFGGPGPGGFGGRQRGQFGPPPGGPGLLMSPEVQQELHLSSAQVTKLKSLMPEMGRRRGGGPGMGGPGGGGPGMGGPGMGGPGGGGPGRGGPGGRFSPEAREKMDKQLKSVLSSSQFARLEQLRLQMEGARAILRPDIAKALGITDSERKSIEALRPRGMAGPGGGRPQGFGRRGGGGGPDGADGPGGPPPPDGGQGGPPPDGMGGGPGGPGGPPPGGGRGFGPEFREKQNAKVLAILTPQQRAKWQHMLGKPFKFPRPPGPGR